MIQDSHRTQVLEAMPERKAAKKRSRTILGAMLAGFGALVTIGSFAALLLLIANGFELTKWSAGLVGVLFLAGMASVAVGAHVASGELVGAAWKDLAGSVRSVWRKNGNGGGS